MAKYQIDPTASEVWISLRIYHVDLDPQQISDELQLQPTVAHKRGEPIQHTRISSAPTGAWVLESKGAVRSTDLEEHLAWMLSRLSTAREALLKLQDVGYDISLVCSWFTSSDMTCPSLTAEHMRSAGNLGLGLWFDIYFQSP